MAEGRKLPNPRLLIKPFLSAEDFNIAFTTAQKAIQKLEALGIIFETTAGKRGRTYCAKEMLSILEAPASTQLSDDN